jgi:hypothetical protein
MRSLNFSIDLNPSSRTMALGSTQPLTKMSTRNLPGDKGRPVREADNLTAMSRKCGSLDVSQPFGPSRPVTGIALPLPILLISLFYLCVVLPVGLKQTTVFKNVRNARERCYENPLVSSVQESEKF